MEVNKGQKISIHENKGNFVLPEGYLHVEAIARLFILKED